jgi:hypothetical protein
MTFGETKEEADHLTITELRHALDVEPSESPEVIAKRFRLTIIQNANGTIVVHPLHDHSYKVAGSFAICGEASPLMRAVLTCAFVTQFRDRESGATDEHHHKKSTRRVA